MKYYLSNNPASLTAISLDATVEAGRVWAKAQASLNEDSLVRILDAGGGRLVAVRKSDQFVNHLYQLPDGRCAAVVVAFNIKLGSVTVSREGDGVPLNCKDLVQGLWGPLADGHAGIAGSPRGQTMTAEDLNTAAQSAAGLLP